MIYERAKGCYEYCFYPEIATLASHEIDLVFLVIVIKHLLADLIAIHFAERCNSPLQKVYLILGLCKISYL